MAPANKRSSGTGSDDTANGMQREPAAKRRKNRKQERPRCIFDLVPSHVCVESSKQEVDKSSGDHLDAAPLVENSDIRSSDSSKIKLQLQNCTTSDNQQGVAVEAKADSGLNEFTVTGGIDKQGKGDDTMSPLNKKS